MGRTHARDPARPGTYRYRLDPAPSKAPFVLASAERRLRGAIKRGASAAQQRAAAERVRDAKLGLLKAAGHNLELPTNADGLDLDERRAHLAAAEARWRSLTVAEILATYRSPV